MIFNKYILGGCAAAILVIGLLGYFFYKENQKLKKENELNKVQIANYTSQISDLEKSFTKAQEDVNRLSALNNTISAASSKRKEELDKVLRTHDLEKIAERKSLYAKLQGQIGQQEEQIKDLNGTVETLTRQLVQAGIKNKVQTAEVQMTKQNLKGAASQELHRQRMNDSQKRHEERLKDTQQNFDARLKNIEKEVELNEKLKNANKKDVATNNKKE